MVKSKIKMIIIKNTPIFGLIIGCLLFGLNATAQTNKGKSVRGLYTYDFGGLEKMEVESIFELLTTLNYTGIVVNGRGESALTRLD